GRVAQGGRNMMMAGRAVLSLLLPLALIQAGHAEDKIRLGHNANSARNIAALPLQVLTRQGLFAREGLVVELVGLPGTTHMVDALDRGIVDVTGTATPYLIQAGLKGTDAVAVMVGHAHPVSSSSTRARVCSQPDRRARLG